MNIRSDFPLLKNNPTMAYFDSSSTTLVPEIAVESVENFLNNIVASSRRGAHSLTTQGSAIVEKTRKSVAEYLKTDPSQVSFQKSIPSAVASFAFGYDWQKQGRNSIVISENEEHSVMVALQRVAQILRLEIRIIPIDKNGVMQLEELDNLVDSNTGIIAACTTTVGWGIHNKLREVASVAHDNDAILLTDATQSIAFDEEQAIHSGADIVIASANIGLMSPPGLAIQWIEKSLGANHIPGILGGSSVADVQPTNYEVALIPDRFESGMLNVPAIAGLQSSIEYLKKLKVSGMKSHMKELAKYLHRRLNEIDAILLYGIPDESSTIFGFNLGNEDDISCHDIALFLDESDIAVRSGLLCAHPLVKTASKEGIIQVSLHAYNSTSDIDNLCENLEIISKDLI
ncbi:MAG: aminotransferase class V-fold PLP-dependent enzyme [Candidatus Thorarchaeota archaeon]